MVCKKIKNFYNKYLDKYINFFYIILISFIFIIFDIYFDEFIVSDNFKLHEFIERIISFIFIIGFGYIFYLLIKRIEKERKVYYDLFEEVNIAILIIKKNKKNKNIIIGFNNMSEKTWGLERNDVLGKEFQNVFPGIKGNNYKGNNNILKAIDKVYEKGISYYIPVVNYIDDKYNKWIENYIFKLPTNEIIIIYTDITKKKKIKEELERSNKEKDLLLKEVHHRVKNNLSIISGLFSLQTSNTNDEKLKTILRDTQNRIMSMALIHEKIYRSEQLDSINFEDHIKSLITRLYETLRRPGLIIDFNLNIEKNVILNINQAVPVTLILNELITNALEHAFVDKKEGKIIINFYRDNGNYIMIVEDNGIGFPKNIDLNNTKTLGLKLVTSLARQLQDDMEVTNGKGTKFKIIFPVWEKTKYDV